MAIKPCCLLPALLALAGCAPVGLLYSNTVIPYSEEFHVTPVGTKTCAIKANQIKEPVTGYGVSAEWTTSYLLREAKKAGISDIDYIDKRTLSILNGLYKRETLIVHGD
jgi:TRL-like protein family